MRLIVKLAVLMTICAALGACASVSLVDTWRNPQVSAPKLKKVLVVSITKNRSSSRVYEDMLSSELSRYGVAAVPGYLQLGADRNSWEDLDSTVRKAAADAVLTVQTIKVEKQTTVQPGYVNSYPGYWYPPAYPAWDLHGYYGSLANYGPTYVTTYDIATIQVNLFDAGSGKLLWAATLEGMGPENVTTVGRELAEIVAKALAKQGLI